MGMFKMRKIIDFYTKTAPHTTSDKKAPEIEGLLVNGRRILPA
jgi:hypothetical protein